MRGKAYILKGIQKCFQFEAPSSQEEDVCSYLTVTTRVQRCATTGRSAIHKLHFFMGSALKSI